MYGAEPARVLKSVNVVHLFESLRASQSLERPGGGNTEYEVPYEFLKDLPKAKTYLKPGVTFEQLDKIAYAHSDNEFATIMREDERKLFQKIRQADRQDGSQRKT